MNCIILMDVKLHTRIVLFIQLVLQSAVSFQQVLLVPSGHVVYPLTGQATIDCLPSSIVESILWLVNDTHLEELNLTNVQIINYGGIEVLNISNITVALNMTTIQCVITLDRGGRVSSHHSGITTLMVQGLLDNTIPVINYNSTISLTWTAPFSLNITNVDPDITYCVDVVDSTSMLTLHSQCGLIDTGFDYSIPSSGVCGDYTFTITPVNVVGNGTSATVQYSQALTAPRVSEQQLMPLSSMQDGIYTYQMTLSSLVCESELTFEDVNTGEETRLGGSDLIISDNIIMFTTAQLNTNRLYSVSVSASNPSGSALSNTSIGTHDVVETFIEKSRESNTIHVTVMYTDNSTATGALFVFAFISDSAVDFKQSSYLLQNRPTDLLSDLPQGSYILFVYDIESTGALKNGVGYPATTDKFVITGNNQKTISVPSSPHISSCNVTSTPDGVIIVLCIYTSRVTGFQMIVQNSALDKVHKLHINQTTNGGQLATVQVEEDGLYRVTVFPIYGDTGIVGSGVGYSKQFELLEVTSSENAFPIVVVGAGAAVLAAFFMIVLGTCLILCYWKINNRSMTANPACTSTDVKPPVPVYEEIGNSPGAFKFTQCPVYGLSADVLMNEDSKDKQ